MVVAVGSLAFVNGLISHLLLAHGAPGFAVGAGITAAIAVVFFLYSHATDRSLKSHLRDHHSVVGRVERSMQARKMRTFRALYANACSLENYCAILAMLGGRSRVVCESEWTQFRDDLASLHRDATVTANALGHIVEDADWLDDRMRYAIAEAAGQLGESASIDDGARTVDILGYQAAWEPLCPVLALLRRRLGPDAAPPLRRPRPDAAPGGMTLRLDCHTYPPGAAIRAEVEADVHFPHHKVAVTICDEDHGKLVKKIETASARGPERRSATTTATLRPKGLEIGREYTARAECGGLVATAAFAVDDIDPTTAPAVHAHRPTCAVGGYMDIAVVDPAACAGGVGNEPAGAAKRPSLTIWLDGREARRLCLEEACRSGGAFHWRVGCVQVDGGGAARAGALGGGRAGARGGGAVDAAIVCKPNQLIRIRYESAAGVARTAVLVEGLGTSSSAAAAGRPDPAAAECEGGGDGRGQPAGGGGNGNGCGGRLHDAGTGPRGRKGDRAGHMQGSSEDGRGRGQ